MYRRQFALIKSSLSLRILIVLTLLLTLGLPGAAEPLQAAGEPVSPFSDLAPSDENYRYVKFLQNKGVINGFPDGTFQPYGSLTRAEAAKMLVTAAGLPLQSTGHPTYSDVSPDHWAYPYIETATHLGLLTGYPDGTFQPQRQLTRAETAVILYRTYGTDYQWSGDPLAVDLPAWAAGPASSIIDAGLMGIDEEKRFQPDWATPRVEFARALALLHTLHDNWRIVPLKATLWPKTGGVQLQKPGQQPVSVTQPAVLAVDDVVITGSRGEAEIRFEDGSALLLTANSELKVQALVGSLFILPDGTEGSAVEDLQVQFLKGSMFGALATRGVDPETLLPQTAAAGNWSMFPLLALAGDNWEAVGYSANATLAANGNIDDMDIDPDSEAFKKLPPWKQLQLKKVKVKVNMPHGVAAVRGSFWKIQLEQIGERIREIINFIHGEGEVQSGDHTVPIRAGEKTAIEEPGAPPTPPEPMTREEQQEWVAMKDWVTERI
ncbi:MAG: hypothetical protein GX750_10470, partial [Clostridia bacterium]|nr:hypothetical protein [Clostridia bacterium]